MGFWDTLGRVGEGIVTLGGSEAARDQADASQTALAQQTEEAARARSFLKGQADVGRGYIQQGTDQAAGALNQGTSSALGAQYLGLNQEKGALANANMQARGDINAGQQGALDALGGSPNRLADLYAGGLASGFQTDPGYQFRLEQGNKNIMQNAAAAGGRHGGDTLKALMGYGQDLASQEYQNYANRQIGLAQGADQSDFARNSAIAGVNQQGGSQLSGLASQYGANLANAYGQFGQGQSNLYSQQGNSLANLYSQAGTNMANIGIGAAGQNNSLAQGMMAAYGAPVQYAGGGWQTLANAGQQGLGLGMAAAMSDRRLKRDIHDGADAVEELLSVLAPYAFRYVDEAHGQGDVLGVMAQDAERSRLGRYLVSETPVGKAIDIRKALGVTLAAAANERRKRLALEDRIAALEARLVG